MNSIMNTMESKEDTKSAVSHAPTKILWSKQLYNPYRHGLLPELLRVDACTRMFYGKKKGMGQAENPILLEVTYDQDYLIKYLVKKVLLPLQIGNESGDFNKLMKVLSMAYKVMQTEKKQDSQNEE